MGDVNIRRLKHPERTTVMLHSADPKLSLNHVEYWLGPLEKSGVTFSVLVRDKASFDKIKAKYPHLQLLYAQSPVDVETVVTAQPNLKLALYPTNRAKNIHLLRFIDLTHVFIGTKNSDRLSKINKSYRAYDEIWVSGKAQIDKFREAIPDTRHLKFTIIGKPQLEDILIDSQHKIDDAYLYLSDNDDFILDVGQFILKEKDKKHIFYTKNKLIEGLTRSALTKNVNLIHLKDHKDIFLFSKNIKYIVTDLKYIDRYLLAFNAPIFVYISKEINMEFLELDIPKECLYFFSDTRELQSVVSRVNMKDTLRDKRDFFSECILGVDETLYKKTSTRIHDYA